MICWLINEQNYDNMTKGELIQSCIDKDAMINKCIESLKDSNNDILNKSDIMALYKCESNKALRILKLMFQMGYGNKIGKEYYISKESQAEFIKDMAGKEVFI